MSAPAAAARTPNKGKTGQIRAFRCMVLLGLHRAARGDQGYGEIVDLGGTAGRKLLSALGIHLPNTPGALSRTLYVMKNRRLIDTESRSNGTYAIWLLGELTERTVKMLEDEEPWARDYITTNGEPELEPPAAPPYIEFAPTGGSGLSLTFPASQASLMAYILGLEEQLRRLMTDNAVLRGVAHDAEIFPGVSPEVREFMTARARLFH